MADVGLLSLGVAVAIATAAVGDARLAGYRVRLFQLMADDDGAVGEDQGGARPGVGLRLAAGRGTLLRGPDSGNDGADEAEQPAAPPRPRATDSGRHVRG